MNDFFESIKKQAENFNINKMSTEDAILYILRKKKINPEIIQNPIGREEIIYIATEILNDFKIKEITSENLEQVQEALFGDRSKYEKLKQNTAKEKQIIINKDGSLNYKYVNSKELENVYNKYEGNRQFIFREDHLFIKEDIKTTTSRLDTEDKQEEIIENKLISTYNKYGIQMRKEYTQKGFSIKDGIVQEFLPDIEECWEVIRNNNLVTCTIKSYEHDKSIKRKVNSNNNVIIEQAYINEKYPNELSIGIPMKYRSLAEMTEEEKIWNKGFVEAYGNYNYIEKWYRLVEQQEKINKLQDYVFKSSLGLRKMAERRGFISKSIGEN